MFCRISPFTAGMWDNGRATPFEFSEVSIHIYRVLGEISVSNGVVFLPRSNLVAPNSSRGSLTLICIKLTTIMGLTRILALAANWAPTLPCHCVELLARYRLIKTKKQNKKKEANQNLTIDKGNKHRGTVLWRLIFKGSTSFIWIQLRFLYMYTCV